MTTSASSYEQEHINFVVSENGTTNGEIMSVLVSASFLPFLANLLLPWVVPASFTIRFNQDVLSHLFIRFLLEFPIVGVLSGALVTVLTGHPEGFSLTSAVTATIILMSLLTLTINHTLTRPKWKSFSEEWQKLKDKDVVWSGDDLRVKKIHGEGTQKKYPFVTNFRGMINFVTTFAILAVDFPIFPRRFAKTKTFGYSLMDIGTGSFIIANGIVSPESKNRAPDLKKAIVSSWPLLALGFGRLLAVKGTEYHEVVEEYGVHWNFFFTLASAKILSALFFSVFGTKSAWKASIAVALLYEMLLIVPDIQNGYVLNVSTPRNGSLLAANREGIFSVLGYMSIYMGSVFAGQLINYKNRRTYSDWMNYLIQATFLGCATWSAFFFWHNYYNPMCRRVANLSYVLWCISYGFTIIPLHATLSLIQALAQEYGVLHGPMVSYQLYFKNLKEKGKYLQPPVPLKTLVSSKSNADSSHSEDEDEIDEELDALDEKLEKATKSKDDKLVAEILKEIEGGLTKVSKKIDGADETEIIDQDKYANLPDLSKSSLFYEALCYNNLFIFLLGNLLTGLVNYCLVTMYARTLVSIAVLLLYITALYFSSFMLYWFNIQLKFW